MTDRYPLWCVDRGPERGETQYLGPYDTEAEATGAADEDDTIRRCRRVHASEIDGRSFVFDRMVEMLDENALGGDLPSVLPEVWGDWEDQMVRARDGAAEAFREFVDRWLRVDAYVCEGDEPAQAGGSEGA